MKMGAVVKVGHSVIFLNKPNGFDAVMEESLVCTQK